MELHHTNVPENAKFCSLHFAESAFDRTSVNCVRILPGVIPSVNKNSSEI